MFEPNEAIGDYFRSKDEVLLTIGTTLLKGEDITDEERNHWVRFYMERIKDFSDLGSLDGHQDSFQNCMAIMNDLKKRGRFK